MNKDMLKTENLNIGCERNIPEIYSELNVYFQPIFNLNSGKIYGYEALIGHKNINIRNLFEIAKDERSLFLLDFICRRNAIKKAAEYKIKDYLFINIYPEALISPHYEQNLTDSFNFPKGKIILEIPESTIFEDYNTLVKIFYYKKLGYKIAIDDFGLGFSGLKLLKLLKPDIVKIDRQLISNLEFNSMCRNFIDFIVSISHEENILVLAEGIETLYQLETVVSCRVDLIQGCYLAVPSENIIDYD
ncbi:MAG: EAL domain-containing protein [Thermodesulfovibrio sp.]|nr:EAL domain-containing protein [Thermodesulfovibrio sp.]